MLERFSGKFISFIDEPVIQCDIPFEENSFADDGDIQIVTKSFDRNS